ncbi:MAG: tetratricopeptide repeat protein, partial [Alphaproteobacteria bacterium]
MTRATLLTLTAIMIAILGGGLVWLWPSQPPPNGLVAFEQGDYGAAFQFWFSDAEQGDPKAQYNLGLLYRDGRGVARDADQAIRWFESAAEKGMPQAQVNLAAIYASTGTTAEDDA